MADISFMLLIFFLLTTSMDADKGLSRQLPTPDDETQQVELDVNSADVLALEVTADNVLLINGNATPMSQLRMVASQFILGRGTNHLISVVVSAESCYESYFALQNQLTLAYQDARDSLARSLFGKSIRECDADEKESLIEHLPQRVAEPYGNEKGGLR